MKPPLNAFWIYSDLELDAQWWDIRGFVNTSWRGVTYMDWELAEG